ncbi:MAG: transferase [Holophagaceae bacterium]|nr:transferase [Holophagaceae bacterium]
MIKARFNHESNEYRYYWCSGFAREVAWLIKDINNVSLAFNLKGFVVSDTNNAKGFGSKAQIIGDFDWLQSHQHEIDGLVFGIGTPQIKLQLSELLERDFPRLHWPNIVHPSVQYDQESATFEHGVVLCAGTIATVNVTFLRHAMVNLMCTIGHESTIGAGAVLNPTVNISGGVTIGSGVLVGTGSQILQYIDIGDGATIGAGAVVSKPVAPGTTVVGIPAKPMAR